MQQCEVIPEQVKQIVESETFEKAPALRALLTFLWLHREETLSEYAIATEALGRRGSFDARIDATVRVQVSRLRQRLEKYYEKEDPACSRRLTIPLGSHQVAWSKQSPRRFELAFSEPPAVAATAPKSRLNPVLAWICVALLGCCVVEGFFIVRSHERTVTANHLPKFWAAFFGNARATRITLPTPTFFSFPRSPGGAYGSIMLRDTDVNDFSAGPAAASYQMLARSFGNASLAENYTVTSDTFAAVRLARYFDQFDLQTEVSSSADNPLEALDHENLIAVGTWGTLLPLKPFLERMSFRLGPRETSVLIRDPQPGEPTRVDAVTESPERGIWPGVISLLPGNGGQTHLLILASRHTSALVSFLTSSNGQEQMEKLWKQKRSPKYFELIVSAELSGRGIVRTWPVALRPYKTDQ